GGTEMMQAIKAALDPSDSKDHIRIACFMTDGEVGNDDEITSEIQKHPKTRVFSFGIGNSVNRYLLDKMAEVGNGEVEYVSLADDGSKAARKFYERVRTPLLTDISIDWNGLPVADMYPVKIPDLFSAKPVIINGRYAKAGKGTIRLRGKVAGQEYSREITVNLPEAEPLNDVLATLWARKRIDQLTTARGKSGVDVVKTAKEITQLGLEFRILTDNTSFVAVEDRVVNQNGKPVTIPVPVAIPEGTDGEKSGANLQAVVSVARLNQTGYYSGGGGGGGNATVDVTSSRVGTTVTSSQIINLPVSRVVTAKRRSGKGAGSGSGSGSGVGYGSGSGSGNGASSGVSYLRMPAATLGGESSPKPAPVANTPEAIRLQKHKDKLHAWLYALADRLAKKAPAGVNEVRFVHDGNASIRITLATGSPAIVEKLRQAGFELLDQKGDILSGRIAIEKLVELADLDEIKLIVPVE
ncbi:MAG: hypothetical protein ABI481_10855, partial [Pyrinomonadaceae bacterium]